MQTAIASKNTVVVHRNPIDWIAGALVIIGALNWGLVGVAQFDLVAAILGAGSMPARIVYALVGLAGVYALIRALVPSRETDVVAR